LMELELEGGALEDLGFDFAALGGLQVEDGVACFVAATQVSPAAVFRMDISTRAPQVVRSAVGDDPSFTFAEARVSLPEAIEFPTAGGRTAHAFYYPPRGFDGDASEAAPLTGLAGEKPPLLVKSHGGPTAATSSAQNLGIQYWTSRGFAVVDVNYGGSSGFGRAYRERLDGQWGVVDVDDCIAAARCLAADGRVDPDRMAISGGSAGGYTTLCALTYHDVFRAGASHYGIGDLEALVRDTHKFESRYMERLVGPYPSQKALYVERSPIHATERLSCPVIFFQGLEDKIVPPNQAEAMAAALLARGIPHAYVPFEGEQHGFRRAENICTALDGELYFYSVVFGFEAPKPPGVEIVSRSA
jgi:dipeptidyl aminopeptidase/acylaminoacyl peptidase